MEARSKRFSVTLAGESEKALIESLSQFYIYDFSEMAPVDSEDFEFRDQNGFGSLPNIDDYWSRQGFYPLLLRLNENPVGFALLNTDSHRGGTIERNMGEFFVVRKHRRRGLATEAIAQILALYPGGWEVAVAERNSAAKMFWPRAIEAAPNVSGVIRHAGDGEHWSGPIWSFRAASVA